MPVAASTRARAENEDGGVGADPEGQGEEGDEGEPRTAGEQPEAEAKVRRQLLHPEGGPLVLAAVGDGLRVAEAEPGRPRRLLR
jgi:hypothetical protein